MSNSLCGEVERFYRKEIMSTTVEKKTEHKTLKSVDEIIEALKVGPVFAHVEGIGEHIVRDAKLSPGKRLLVKLLEGWREPQEVWTEA
jgi:hypothetical protein